MVNIPSSLYIPQVGDTATRSTSPAGIPTLNVQNRVLASQPRKQVDFVDGGGAAGPTADSINYGGGDSLYDAEAAQAAASAAQAAAARQAQVNAVLAGLAPLDTVRSNARTRAQQAYEQMLAQYGAEDARDQENYNKQTFQNEQNLSTNRQAALSSAAQGGKGLRSVLAAMGALSGTGQTLANRAVSNQANLDLGQARNAFDVNADTLGTAWSDVERQQRQRRTNAASALENEQAAADLDYYRNQQNVYNRAADIFGAGTPEGNDYIAKATSLYAPIAGATRTNVAKYDAASPLYSQQALQNYKAGTGDMTVGMQGGASSNVINNPLYALSQRRREEQIA